MSGENLSTVADFTPLLAGGALDIVQIQGQRTGITGALQIASLAQAFDLPVTVNNSPGHFMAHVAAALPNHLMTEVVVAEHDGVMRTGIAVEDGHVVLDDAPGLGIELDEQALAGHRMGITPLPIPGGRAPRGGLTL